MRWEAKTKPNEFGTLRSICYAIEIDNCQVAGPRRSLDVLSPRPLHLTPPLAKPTTHPPPFQPPVHNHNGNLIWVVDDFDVAVAWLSLIRHVGRRGNAPREIPLGAASLNTLSLAAAGDKFLRKFVYGKMRSNEDFKRSGRVAVWCNMKVAKNVNHNDVGNEWEGFCTWNEWKSLALQWVDS